MHADETKVEESTAEAAEMSQPIIIELGRQKRSKIKDLKEGRGSLWDEVLDVVDEVKEMLGDEAEGGVLVPIIMIYEKKRRTTDSLGRLLFPLAYLDYDDDDDDEDDD